MKINFALLLAFVGAILVFLATPGPVTLSVVAISSKQGLKKAVQFISGTNLASLILIGFAILGIFGLLQLNETVLDAFKFVGSIFLGFFGFKLIRNALKQKDGEPKTQGRVNQNMFLNGFGIGLSNPKDILFFLAFFPQFSQVAESPGFGLLILSLTWILLDYSILIVYSIAAKKIRNSTIQKYLNLFSGFLFIAVGIFSIAVLVHGYFK